MIDIEEAATLLDVPVWTIRRWIRQGLLSPESDGVHLNRERLELWAKRHGLKLRSKARANPATPHDFLADAVARGAFLDASNLESASEAIACLVEAHPGLEPDSREELLKDIISRERQASTALGNGIALPHPRRAPKRWIREPSISILRSPRPIDWAALDGRPVHLVLLPLAPKIRVHLELLSRLSFALGIPGIPTQLREAPTQENICTLIRGIRMQR